MKVLVPLPMDLSEMANGRSLRVVHLLRELNRRCSLTCVVPADRRGESARQALPNVRIETAEPLVGEKGTVPISPHSDGLEDLPGIEPSTLLRRNGDSPRTRLAGRPTDLLLMDRLSRRAIDFIGFDEALLRATVGWAEGCDAVLGFDVVSLAYLLAVRLARRGRGPRVVCDLIDDPWITYRSQPWFERMRAGGLKQAVVVRRLRSRLIGLLDGCTAVAPRDAASLARATGRQVRVVPNGVIVPETYRADALRENLVVFTGAMQFPPNVAAACWLVRRVWPRVLRALGGDRSGRSNGSAPAQLAIVGTSPAAAVRRLAEVPGVVVTGAVADVNEWLRRARVAAVPMTTGSGIKNKVLEAGAAACAVVSTSLGVAGLPSGDNNGSLVADRPAAFAEKIVTLLENPALARAIGLAGRAMVGRQYRWPRMAELMMEVLRGPEAEEGTDAPGTGSPASAEGLQGPCESSRVEEALTHAAP